MKDYVKATNDAARRTRTVTIVLVVASVLVAIGYYNSLQWSWGVERVREAFDNSDTARESIAARLVSGGHKPDLIKEGPDKKTEIDKYREYLQEATAKAYVENILTVKAPFFGIAFDVNDLGVIGGLGLVIILLVMRYSLSREIKNLNVTLREAVHHDKLPEFYHALAMRQVFTVPHMKGEKRNRWLGAAPRVICLLPACVFFLGVFYDYYSILRYGLYSFTVVTFTLVVETFWLILIVYLATRCWERQSHIDGVWEQHWNRLEGLKSAVIRLKEDLVQEFGSDEVVDGVLRRFRTEA